MKIFPQFLVSLFLLSSPLAFAGDMPPAPLPSGRYVLSGDSGTLTIRKDASGQSRFAMETMGGNCHTCSVAGVLRGKTGYAESGEEGEGKSICKISFGPVRTGIEVGSITPEECRYFCGMRAGFDGLYRPIPANCSRESQQLRRNDFLKRYRSRQFAEAGEKLSVLLTECRDFIHWIEIDRIRNDLALAQFHGGDPQACLKTLAATRAGASANAQDLGLPPCDQDSYIAVAKATWHNRSLCARTRTRTP